MNTTFSIILLFCVKYINFEYVYIVKMASGPGMPNTTNEELIDAVRHWVHFDNLAEVLSKQVVNARALQSTYEEKIMTILDSTGNSNAILNISGATLQKQSSVKEMDIDIHSIRTILKEYFVETGEEDTTEKIMAFFEKQRGGKVTVGLKKTMSHSA